MGIVQVIIDDTASKTITGTYVFDRDNGGTFVGAAGATFPTTPEAGEWFWRTDESKLYRRNSGNTAWEAVTAPAIAHASTHAAAGSDPVTVTEAQVTGLVADLAACEKTANKNQPSGYAGLDASSKLTGAQQVYGSAANTACQGNDARLSDSRTPTAHASTHQPGGTDAMAVDAAAGTGSLRTLGTGTQQACAGNDSRLSDARTPTAHAATHAPGSADAIPTGTTNVTVCIGNDSRLSDSRTPTAHASSHNAGGADALAIDAAAGTGSLRTLGTAATAACAGNDARLSDDRTASGLRTATTVVATAAAAAPSAGQVLTATGGSAAAWQTPSAIWQQSVEAEVTADTTTTSATFVDLLSIRLTTGAGFLLIRALGACSNTTANTNNRLRVLVDGVSIGGSQFRARSVGIAEAFAIQKRAAVTAGSHGIKLQWARASGTLQCRPVTNVDAERASLLVEEVTA